MGGRQSGQPAIWSWEATPHWLKMRLAGSSHSPSLQQSQQPAQTPTAGHKIDGYPTGTLTGEPVESLLSRA